MKPPSVLTDVRSSSRTAEQLLVRHRERVDPERLHARTRQEAARRAVRQLLDPGREHAGEPLLVGGQPLLERGGDVDVPVELVDERHRDLVLDVLVRDQLFGRAAEGVRVERLVADEPGEEPDRRQQREHDDEDPGGQHLAPGWGHAGSPSFCSHTAAFRNAPATMRRAIR